MHCSPCSLLKVQSSPSPLDTQSHEQWVSFLTVVKESGLQINNLDDALAEGHLVAANMAMLVQPDAPLDMDKALALLEITGMDGSKLAFHQPDCVRQLCSRVISVTLLDIQDPTQLTPASSL